MYVDWIVEYIHVCTLHMKRGTALYKHATHDQLLAHVIRKLARFYLVLFPDPPRNQDDKQDWDK